MPEKTFHIGQRLSYSGDLCTVRYIGDVEGTTGEWLGVEWDNILRGKHSGEHNGRQYFECTVPSSGSFIRPSRTPDPAISFLTALRKKYTTADDPKTPYFAVSVSRSKVMEEVGFDKILEKLSHLHKLKIILLDGFCISRADDFEVIRKTCPSIEDLDISRNVIEDFAEVAKICAPLENLTRLRASGNRFVSIEDFKPTTQEPPFSNVTSLELDNTLLTWPQITHLLSFFPSLTSVTCTHNLISHIPVLPPVSLTSVDLSYNTFTSLSALGVLSDLPSLQTIILSHNILSDFAIPPGTIFPKVSALDLSYNAISSFSALDCLPPAFPALESVRVSHSPLYDGVIPEEAHMLTVARLPPSVSVVNHSAVTEKERENAEMWYLGRIARELTEAGETRRQEVLSRHRRWDELCKMHGAPSGDNKSASTEDRTFKGRLIELEFVEQKKSADDASTEKVLARRIPRSTPVSTVRGLAARWFGIKPLHVQLQLDVSGEEIRVLGDDDDVREIGNYVDSSMAGGKVLVAAR